MNRPYRWEDVPRQPHKGMGDVTTGPNPSPGYLNTDAAGNTTVSLNPFGVPVVESNLPGEISFSPMMEWVAGNISQFSNADITTKAKGLLSTSTQNELTSLFEKYKWYLGFGVVGFILMSNMGRGRR